MIGTAPAPPLAGRNLANPCGAILSAALMLETLGVGEGARRIEQLMLLPHLESLLACGSGDVKIYELNITAEWDGRTVGDGKPGPLTLALIEDFRRLVAA